MKFLLIFIILSTMYQDRSANIFDFKNAKNTSNWYVVNDGVMGGLSQGTMVINDAGNALFKGFVTTENNGGFSSVRYALDKREVFKYSQVVLRLKGDGKSYQFRIKEKSSQRFSYISSFKTSGDWQTLKLPFSTFHPAFRGNQLDMPNFSGDSMEEVAILIGNKVKEAFALEIEKIYVE